MRKRNFIFGDTHFPYHNRDVIDFGIAMLKRCQQSPLTRIDIVHQIGDLIDWYAVGNRHPRSLSVMTPAQEVLEARQTAEEFWKLVKRAAPLAECIQHLGNHCVRPIKYAMSDAPMLEPFIRSGIRQIYKFEGVTTQFNMREVIEIDGVVYTHGHRKFGDHVKEFMKSVVHGHTHKGGVYYHRMHNFNMRDNILFELDVGFMADFEADAMAYTSSKAVNWTHGVGIVDEFGARFIPYRKDWKKAYGLDEKKVMLLP